jgi:hypothetical protein
VLDVLGGRDGKMFWIYCRKDRREREKEWARAGKRERSMAGRVKVPLLALQLASGRRRRLLIAPWVKPFSESNTTPRPMRHSWLLEQWTVEACLATALASGAGAAAQRREVCVQEQLGAGSSSASRPELV